MKLNSLLVFISLVFCSNFAYAEDKYDLAVASYQYDTPKSHIVVSVNGDKFEVFDVEKDELQGKIWGISVNPLIKHVNKMQNEGWEVVGGLTSSYNSSTGVSLLYYSLRKKR